MRHKGALMERWQMGLKKSKAKSFRELLEKYIEIKGLDIIILLADGKEVELYKNRMIMDDELVTFDKNHSEKRIPLSEIKSVDLYAA